MKRNVDFLCDVCEVAFLNYMQLKVIEFMMFVTTSYNL